MILGSHILSEYYLHFEKFIFSYYIYFLYLCLYFFMSLFSLRLFFAFRSNFFCSFFHVSPTSRVLIFCLPFLEGQFLTRFFRIPHLQVRKFGRICQERLYIASCLLPPLLVRHFAPNINRQCLY